MSAMNQANEAGSPPPLEKMIRVSITMEEAEHEKFMHFWLTYRSSGRFEAEKADKQRQVEGAIASLGMLMRVVMSENFGCGSSYPLAGALASIYNGDRVKANLFRLGIVDRPIIEALLQVIRLHVTTSSEIHTYFHPGAELHHLGLGRDGSELFERMIREYRLEPRRRKAS